MNNIITVKEIKLQMYDDKDKNTKGWLSALPNDVNAFIWERAIWNAYKKCPTAKADDFKECVLKAVRDGLIPDGREAVILPYKKKRKQGGNWVETGEVTLTYIPMVAGVVKRIYSGNIVKRIVTHIVHEKDDFDMWTDKEGDNIQFKPLLRGDRGQPIGAFAMAFLSSGETIMRYMSKEEIDKRRKESKAGEKDDAPWVKWWNEMAKKTVIHNMFKMIPLESAAHDMLLDSIDAPDKENTMMDVTYYVSDNDYEPPAEYNYIENEPSLSPPPIKKADVTGSLMNQSDDPFGRE